MRRFGRYMGRLMLALNMAGNIVLGGDSIMTVSARSGFARDRGAAGGTFVCGMLNVLDLTRDGATPGGDHCTVAMRAYFERRFAQGEKFPIDMPWNNGFQWWIPRYSKSIFVAHPADTTQICVEPVDGGDPICESPDSPTMSVIDWNRTDWPALVRILREAGWSFLDASPGEQG